MMRKVFRELYEYDFDNFTVWHLVQNVELRQWLQDSEVALALGKAEVVLLDVTWPIV